MESLVKPQSTMRVCAFLYVYFGFPASCYEGINVEDCRYRCGRALAKRDTVKPDLVAGVPDSGTGHALGYSHESRIPYKRPFAKYTPTWLRSFMPADQTQRALVARNPDTPQNAAMVEVIRKELGLTTLSYQRLDDLLEAIGLPREKICTHCWSGEE